MTEKEGGFAKLRWQNCTGDDRKRLQIRRMELLVLWAGFDGMMSFRYLVESYAHRVPLDQRDVRPGVYSSNQSKSFLVGVASHGRPFISFLPW